MIPQMPGGGSPNNVLFGDFRAKGDSVWAVACVSHGRGGTLVFHSDTLAPPDSLDWTTIQGEANRYVRDEKGKEWTWTREISIVDPGEAMKWCRAGRLEGIHVGLTDFSYQIQVGAHYFEEGRWHDCPDWPEGD